MDIRIPEDTKQEEATLNPDPAQPDNHPEPAQSETLPVAQPVAGPERPRTRRGFAAMDPNLVREISRKGGKAAHEAGKAHEFTPEEARAAGRKGGLASHAKRHNAA